MANIKQQKKRIGIAQRQRMENLRYRSTIKTLFNRLQLSVDTGEKDVAEKTHRELVQLLDRSIARGTLHRNTAARKKARAARMLLQEPKTDATTIRKAKKKVAPVRKKAAPKAKKAEKAEEPKVEEAPVEETAAAADEAPSGVAADEPAAPEAEAAVDAPAEEPEAAAADEGAEAADEAKD